SEYRSAKRGESFKWELMNVINQVMKLAKSKKQFCYMMKQQGYGVRWEDNRKYITYTCPNKRKCRDNKLHGEKYRKEMLEHEFEIRRTESDVRQGIVGNGRYSADGVGARFQLESADRIEPTDVAGAVGDTANAVSAVNENGNRTGVKVTSLRAKSDYRNLSGVAESGSGTVGNSGDPIGESNSRPILTGWEAERGIWLEAERARRIQAQAQLESCQVDSALAVGIDSIVSGVTAVASIIEDEPAEDTEYAREHVDSKSLAEERERKEALGIHMG
ncbi:MAG: relaxase, partial [Ruminococcus sp.]|nr:relaxase [Ruminococcus sp.]